MFSYYSNTDLKTKSVRQLVLLSFKEYTLFLLVSFFIFSFSSSNFQRWLWNLSEVHMSSFPGLSRWVANTRVIKKDELDLTDQEATTSKEDFRSPSLILEHLLQT